MQSREFLLRVQDILAEIVVVEQAIAGLSYERIVIAFRRFADDITTRNDSVTARSDESHT